MNTSSPPSTLQARTVQVVVPRHVLFDLEKMQDVQKQILGRLGCQACTSGFNIHFLEEAAFVVRENAGRVELAGLGTTL